MIIKARATLGDPPGQDTVFLGLDRESIRRLLDNQPIKFNGAQIGIRGVTFVILAGETLDDVQEDLRAIGVVP